jgi:cation diffusion facilitator family transporter
MMDEPNGRHTHSHDETKVVATSRGRILLSIFEEGVPPRFRMYFTDRAGRPMPLPADQQHTVQTVRKDGSRQDFVFEARDGEYLEATSMLPEPHSFEATVSVTGADPEVFDVRFDEGDRDHPHSPGRGLSGLIRGALHLGHDHGDDGHLHVSASSDLLSSERGIWALKWSFFLLGLTAVGQAAIVALTGSAGLLADTIHNFADASTAIPLWIAFRLQQRSASQRFTFGLHRTEDLAGVAIVAVIFTSALVAGYTSVERLITQQMPSHIPVAMVAAGLGFVGNEIVAQLRLRIGREIESAALIADGLHARTDGFTSLAALLGLGGALAGYPVFDGVAGLVITVLILKIVLRDAAPGVFTHLLDGIEPATVDMLRDAAAGVGGVEEVNWIRARWAGHRIDVEVNVRVDGALSIDEAHQVTHEVEHQMGHVIEHPGHLVVVASTHREQPPEGHVHSHHHLVVD